MAPLNFLHFLTVVSLAVLQASFDAIPVNALAVEHSHLGRGLSHAHVDIAKKRDPSSKKCRPRPTSIAPKAAAAAATPPSSAPSSQPSQPAQTTTSSQSSSTYTPSSSGGGKSLLAWSNNEQGSLKNFAKNKPMIYNWKVLKYPKGDLGPSWDIFETMDFIPTVHDRGELANIGVLKAGYANKVFNVNEPEINGVGYEDWYYNVHVPYIAPLVHEGYQLFTPSVTTSDAGFNWLQNFMNLCNQGDCGISAMNIHHYSIDAQQLMDATTKFYNAFKMQIWLGEIGCQDYSGGNQGCNQATFNTFFSAVMNFVKSDSRIEKIAWFGFFTASEIEHENVSPTNVMMDCSGGPSNCVPNDLGKTFLSY